MFEFLKAWKKIKFDRKVLRKNDISILILDERWKNLFANTRIPPEIKKCEHKIKDLMKEEARLRSELKNISPQKKKYLEKIMVLTKDAFEKNNAEAREEMQRCEKEVKKLNEDINKIDARLNKIPDDIREINIELLELTVNTVYYKIRSNEKRVKELDKIIEESRNKLKEYTEERETLAQDDTDIYSYFHNLLGGEELEKLDKKFFGQKK